jgi:hypothetical protein
MNSDSTLRPGFSVTVFGGRSALVESPYRISLGCSRIGQGLADPGKGGGCLRQTGSLAIHPGRSPVA